MEALNPNLNFHRPLSLPVAGMVEDYLSMVNRKVLAEVCPKKQAYLPLPGIKEMDRGEHRVPSTSVSRRI